jgi:hypothetical protein
LKYWITFGERAFPACGGMTEERKSSGKPVYKRKKRAGRVQRAFDCAVETNQAAFFVTGNRFDRDLARFFCAAPGADAHPFLGFQILIVGEEMLDLLEHDVGQIRLFVHVAIIREGRIIGDTDQLFVATMLVL